MERGHQPADVRPAWPSGTSLALYEHIQNKSVLIYGSSEPMLIATDRNTGLIQMPLVGEPTGTAAANVVGEGTTRVPCPQANRLVRGNDPTSGPACPRPSAGSKTKRN